MHKQIKYSNAHFFNNRATKICRYISQIILYIHNKGIYKFLIKLYKRKNKKGLKKKNIKNLNQTDFFL